MPWLYLVIGILVLAALIVVGLVASGRRRRPPPPEAGARRAPASVAVQAVQEGSDRQVDTGVVDTAGRLQNKAGLMDELGKVKRVIEKLTPVSEVLLVLAATTGQTGLVQARVFSEVVDVTGIVLTN